MNGVNLSVPPGTHPAGTELAALVRRAHGGEAAARQELVQRNLRLVLSVARRFKTGGHDEDDLFQVGCVGLLKAVDRFDPERGVAFSTLAVPYIMGEIRSHLRDEHGIKVSRGVREAGRAIEAARQRLSSELGREPTVAELAVRTGMAVDRVIEVLDAVREPVSLQEVIFESDGEPVLREAAVAADEDDQLERLALRDGLARLPERERLLVELRFFTQKTQAEVGRRLGISQVQVSRLERRALARLREALS